LLLKRKGFHVKFNKFINLTTWAENGETTTNEHWL